MINSIRNIYLNNRLFWCMGMIAACFVLSFRFTPILVLAQLLLIILAVLVLVEVLMLYSKRHPVEVVRILPPSFSLHDENLVKLECKNMHFRDLKLRILDELPIQLQIRNQHLSLVIPTNRSLEISYQVRPFQRGIYLFRNINVFLSGMFGLTERRLVVEAKQTVKVYPSIIQMKKFSLYTMKNIAVFNGMKKMRRIGHSYEFDQIKQYVHGDDIRSINWKATSRSAGLMVNHYEDEKAQQVYCLIDKSRTMKMPFDQLTLMDYAINTSLVISNVAIQKQDKAGIISFSNATDTVLVADRHAGQMRKILETLYNEKSAYAESSYDHLYHTIRKVIHNRSLLFLFTNFESHYAIERVTAILRRLNKLHLLVVIFFENDEIRRFGKIEAQKTPDIYLSTYARKFVLEKQLIAQDLNKYGIQTIVTSPQDLSINTLNKYLELKSRGLI